MLSQNFVNLRTHTNYSLSEGMLTSNYIVDFCINDMQPLKQKIPRTKQS